MFEYSERPQFCFKVGACWMSLAGSSRPIALKLRQFFQESGQVVGHIIDMGGIAAFQLPVLAHHLFGAIRHHQDSGHAELMWRYQVAGQILEHGCGRGIDLMKAQELVIGFWRRLRFEFGGDDVEHRLEMRTDPEPLQNLVGVISRAICQDQLAPGQLRDRRAHRRIRLQG